MQRRQRPGSDRSPRGGAGTCLRRTLAALVLLATATATVAVGGERQRVFIAGDSTASAYPAERAPREGWGMRLQPYLREGWDVRNHAQSGRSARSFVEQGWLDGIAAELRAGDVLLVQFGHNDAKVEDPSRYSDPAVAYPQWLGRYVALARERGATPVLVTPVARRKFDGSQLLDTHGPYPQAMRELAGREDVVLVDLTAATMDWLRALGDAGSKPYYLHVPAQRLIDDTHFSGSGADAVACLLAATWRAADAAAPVRAVRVEDCAAIPAASAAAVSPSVVVNEREIATTQPGPHDGDGTTTAYPFFADATGFDLVFRKRALHPGASIGAHVNDKDEIYYVLSGRGVLELNGQVREVGPGDAILTRNGDSHALRQSGDEDLVIFIVFDEGARTP
jgi:lysophospholipase L1-like esterase/quercetin dioxygenase-like cupin family protein